VSAAAKMTGISFLPLLKGEPFTPRKYVFTERGPHGSAPVTVTMKSSGYDRSQAALGVHSRSFAVGWRCPESVPGHLQSGAFRA
jgi:hypothetical protein